MKHNTSMKAKKRLKIFLFLIPFLILFTISLLLMYHAKYISSVYDHHFQKQLLWFIIGIILVFLCHFIPTKKLFQYSFILYLVNLCFLVLVLFVGTEINGARAWFDFKYFHFQPSELMKFTYSLFLANFISNKKCKNWKEELFFILLIGIFFFIPAILIFLEPDTGAILFLFFITIVLLWNANIHRWWFVLLGLLIAGVGIGFFYFYFWNKDILISLLGTSFFYRVERLFHFRSGMQIENAMIAIGSAPITRLSLTTPGIYIPESPTDFAFALSSNVLGLLGPLLILICFLFLNCSFFSYYQTRKGKKEKLFTLAFFTIFFLSQLINISMNLGLFPIIGIPLPFVSYGGSSTIVLFLYLGVLFSFQKKKKI